MHLVVEIADSDFSVVPVTFPASQNALILNYTKKDPAISEVFSFFVEHIGIEPMTS